MSEQTSASKQTDAKKSTETNQVAPSSQWQPTMGDVQQVSSNPTESNLTPDMVMYLQRTIGNAAVGKLINRMPAHNTPLQRSSHERGCSCPACRSAQLMRTPIQRDGESGTTPAPEETIKKEDLADKSKMETLAKSKSVADFKKLATGAGIAANETAIALIKYFSPLALADLEPLVAAMDAAAKKTLWSDATLMTQAEAKIGKDPYLTFITQLGMFQPTTTAELGEGGKEHTAPPKADEYIHDKLSAYVSDAVKAGKKIEGQVAVVAGADWDRAGIAHYGEAVWKTGPPPKTPKKDAINGFVDNKGRVWVERNSGNPGTIIHEGIHKYANDSLLNQLGFYMNEGITEYFTRIICKDLSIDRGNYDSQYAVVNALVTATSEALVAKAYFDGDIAGLKAAFITFRKDKKSDSEEDAGKNWDKFVKKFEDGDFTAATNLSK